VKLFPKVSQSVLAGNRPRKEDRFDFSPLFFFIREHDFQAEKMSGGGDTKKKISELQRLEFKEAFEEFDKVRIQGQPGQETQGRRMWKRCAAIEVAIN